MKCFGEVISVGEAWFLRVKLIYLGISRRQRIVIGLILFLSLAYMIILQALLIFNSPSKSIYAEMRKVCAMSNIRKKNISIRQLEEDSNLPTIYVITPTYKRPEMLPELTRLGQTLLLVPQIRWVVAEDSVDCTESITQLLVRLGLPFAHIASPMPDIHRHQKHIPRGVSNRRAALQWVKYHGDINGVLYFLDDDNTIDIRLFDEMRDTKKISMWPVGLIGEYTVSSPVLNKEGLVTGFYDGWPAGRKFQVDMAGFGVNVGYMKKQKAVTMPYMAGHEEDGFIKSLNITLSDIEVKANGCTEILVWHTRTAKNPTRTLNLEKHKHDNIEALTNQMRHIYMIN